MKNNNKKNKDKDKMMENNIEKGKEQKKDKKVYIIIGIITFLVICVILTTICIYFHQNKKIENEISKIEEEEKEEKNIDIAKENIESHREYNLSYTEILNDDFDIVNELNKSVEDLEKYDMQKNYNIQSEKYYDVSYSKLKELFENQNSFVLYMGFPNCPWCKDLIHIFNEIVSEKDLNILVLDTKKASDEGDTDKLKEDLKQYIGEYYNSNQSSNNAIKVPKILFVKKGKIQYAHEYTKPGHNAKIRDLEDDEKNNILKSLKQGFDRLEDLKLYNFKRNSRYID